MHPVIEEICRQPGVQSVQPMCFRKWQRQLRDEIQPLLDELETRRAAQPPSPPAKRRERTEPA